MGCQVEIADKIVAHKADYVLALKGNQPTLEADTKDYFDTAPAAELEVKTTVEKGHGRIETRTFTASGNVDWIASDRSYPGQPGFTTIKTLVKVHSRTEYHDAAPSTPATSFHPPPSISNAWPPPSADIGGWRACTGCSTSSSATTCRAIEPDMEPKTWPSSAASPSVSCAPISAREASKHAESAQAGTPSSCSKFSSSNSR